MKYCEANKNISDYINMLLNDDAKMSRISPAEEAFLNYYYIKTGQFHKVKQYIKSKRSKLELAESSYFNVAFYIWTAGEYMNSVKDLSVLDELSEILDESVQYIENEWKRPRANWYDPEMGDGIYLSNIAIAYGAVQSINSFLKSEKTQRLLMDIRSFMFDKFLKEGSVISKLGDSCILGDMSIIAVPFALMDAGNQILVESMNYVENNLVTHGVRFSQGDTYYGGCIRNDLTCLMVWYYSERGDISRAKKLIDSVEKVFLRDGKLFEVDIDSCSEKVYCEYWMKKRGEPKESILAYILYAIGKHNIGQRGCLQADGQRGLKIIHNPTGSSCPYIFQSTKRFPRHPEDGDRVFIKMTTLPFNNQHKAYIYYSVNGKSQQKLQMEALTHTDGEKHYTADMGCFNYGDKVEYSFMVDDGSNQVTSHIYEFKVRKWSCIDKISKVYTEEGNIVLLFECIEGIDKVPCLEIQKYNSETVRLRFSFEESVTMSSQAQEITNIENLQLNDCILEIMKEQFAVNIFSEDQKSIFQSYKSNGKSFIEVLTDSEGDFNKIRFNTVLAEDENIFGMGERYSKIEYRGENIDNYVYNQYRDQGLRTYIPVPLAVSSKGYGIFFDTFMYSSFSIGTVLSDLFQTEADIADNKIDMYVFVGSPKMILEKFSGISQKPKLPPKWAFGPWISSNNWDSQKVVYNQVELNNKYQIPATVIVIEQWSDEATFYIFNDALYEVKDGNLYFEYKDFTFPEWGRWPDPKKMVEDLHKQGLKVLLWQAPVQKYMDGIAHAQRDEDERVMLKNGYNIKHINGEPYRIPSFEWFKGSLVPDFTNPHAADWWLGKRNYLAREIGIDGFKTDGGECIYGEDIIAFDGTRGGELRNKYPNQYIRSYYEFINSIKEDDAVTFSRAGYTGSQGIPLHWAGDERSTFQAFRASIRAGLSAGMSGIPFWGWDFGGFNGDIPTAELYLRSAQMAAFCPVMQYHAETKGEYNRDRTPWNIAERTGKPYVLDIFKKYADLRMNMLPYIYCEAVKSSITGVPMMRAMFLEYPFDKSCRELDNQYMFGESLLVAPIVEEGAYTRNVYFPGGKWMDIFTGKEIEGSCLLSVKAEIDCIPVYIKENSVIPLNLSHNYKLCSHVGNKVDAYQNLCFMIYATDEIEYKFTDDLSNKVDFNCIKTSDKCRVEIQGSYNDDITLILRNLHGAKCIKVNDESIKESHINELGRRSYGEDEEGLYIRINDKHAVIDIFNS